MNEGTLTKRHTWIFDSFKGNLKPTSKDLEFDSSLREGFDPGRIGTAMDMRFTLTNPNKKVNVIRGYVEDTLPNSYDGSDIACLLVDVVSYSSTLHVLSSLHRYLVRDGLIYAKGYEDTAGVKVAVDEFISTNNLTHQIFNFGGNTFIKNKINPVSFIKPSVSKSDRAAEEIIPVSRAKAPKPFADRYNKPVIEEFVPKQTVKEGLQVIGKKVSR